MTKAKATNPLDLMIAPTDDEFDGTVGKKGRPDVVTPLMDQLLAGALEQGMEQFQIPDGAEFTDPTTGKTYKLNVDKVRRWQKHGPVAVDIPKGKRISVGGGEDGKNIAVRLVAA